MEVLLVSLLNGLVYGMLLFMLASGLTLIFSMMGVLNFAHALDLHAGCLFRVRKLPAGSASGRRCSIAPLLCGLLGAAIEVWGLRRVHHNGHIAELLFTFGLVFIIGRSVQMAWGMLPDALPFPGWPTFRCHLLRLAFPAYRAFMLLVSAGMLGAICLLLKRTRIGMIIQAALTHPGMGPRWTQFTAGFHHRVCRWLFAGRPCRGHRRQLPIDRAWDRRRDGSYRFRGRGVRWTRFHSPDASSPPSSWAWSPPSPS